MKKKRTAQACDRCSKKKIRCDGEAPCENCSKASTECTFSRGPRRRGPRTGYMAVINQRLHQMEQLLIGSGAGAANANTGPLPMIPSNSSSLNSLPVSREDSTPLSLSAGSVIPNHDEDDAEPVITGLFAAQFSDQSRRHSGPATFQAPPQHRPIADFLYDQTTQSPTTKKGATSSSSASAHQSSSTSFSSFGSNPDSVMNYRSDATLGLGTIDSLSTFSGSSSSLLQQLPMTYQENEKESASLGASNGTEHGGASSSTHVPFTGLSMGEDMLDQTLRFSSIRPPTDSSDQPSASGQPPHNPPSSSLTGNVGNTNSSSAGPSALSGSNSFLPIIHAPPVRRPSRQEITPAEYSHLWRDEPDWKLLDIFFSHVYPSVALIPRLAFYQIAYEEPGLLLNAMYALAAGFQQSENGEVDRNAGLAYLTEAKNQLVAEIETPSFGIVYALYLLSYYATRKCFIWS